MFMNDPTKSGAISIAAYAVGAVLLSMAVAWSAAEVSATLMKMTSGTIIDGSGKAETEDPDDIGRPTSVEVTPAETPAEPSASRTIIPPTRVSSDDTSSGYDVGHGRDAYRTYCVRLCDGFYWPIGSSTPSGRLNRDAAACQASCDGPARLFVHRTSHGGPGTMVSLEGVPYASLKTAFQFRSRYDEQCRCRAQPWAEASTDRHKLYAATAAAKKGDRTAEAEAKRLAAKVQDDRAQVQATRDAANAAANRQLATIATESKPSPSRRSRHSLDDPEAMSLGMKQDQSEPQRRGGFVPASGNGRAWIDRVFSGN